MPNPLHAKAYKNVTFKLKTARLEAGLTQTQVAIKLKKPQSFVSKIENAERRVDVAELAILARIYQKDISYFVS